MVEQLGLPVSFHLPTLGDVELVRTQPEVENRLFCMLAVAATAYGLPAERARAWLRSERLWDSLSIEEARFLDGEKSYLRRFKQQIEAMWALAWSLGVTDDLDVATQCPSDFVTMLPDLQTRESTDAFRKRTHLRELPAIVEAADLAYCLHWAIRQLERENKRLPEGIRDYVIRERRRALEWLVIEADWYEITLDT